MARTFLITLALIAVVKAQTLNGGFGGSMLNPFGTQQSFVPRTALGQMLGQTNQGLLGTGNGGLGGLAGQGFQNPLVGGNLFGQGQGLLAQNQGQGLFNQGQGFLPQGQGLFGQGQNLLGQGQGQGLFGTSMLTGQANNMFRATPNNFLGQSNNLLGQNNRGLMGLGNTGAGMQGLLGQTGFGNQGLLTQSRGGMFGQGLQTNPLVSGLGTANMAQGGLNDPLVMSMLLGGGDSSDALLLSMGSGAGAGGLGSQRSFSRDWRNN